MSVKRLWHNYRICDAEIGSASRNSPCGGAASEALLQVADIALELAQVLQRQLRAHAMQRRCQTHQARAVDIARHLIRVQQRYRTAAVSLSRLKPAGLLTPGRGRVDDSCRHQFYTRASRRRPGTRSAA